MKSKNRFYTILIDQGNNIFIYPNVHYEKIIKHFLLLIGGTLFGVPVSRSQSSQNISPTTQQCNDFIGG